jgi:metallophosphoesterase superfamily enzyme
VIQSEEKTKQMIIDSLKDIEWDVMQGNTDAVMTKLQEAQKLAREWIARKA